MYLYVFIYFISTFAPNVLYLHSVYERVKVKAKVPICTPWRHIWEWMFSLTH